MISLTFAKYILFLHAVKKSIIHSSIEALKKLPPRSQAMAEHFLDPIFTNFPSFKLNALLRPGRLFQKLSNGLHLKEYFFTPFLNDIRPALPYQPKKNDSI